MRRRRRFPCAGERLVSAGTFALFAACALVLLIPHPAYAGIIGDFLDIPNMIKTWLLQIAATLFNTYFGVINQTLDAKFISGPFNELFGTTEPYGVVKDFYQAGVIPVAHAILGLFMLMQLIKISQRIDATSTLPAVKDIVFLVVTYCILSYFIDNALDLVSAIYGIFNDLVGNVSDKLQSKNWYEPGIEMTKDDAADATFGGCFLLLIFGLISWAVGLVFYAVSMVVALGRSVQLYVYAAFSPIPISLLGFEETKQIGIGYLKNFAAAALAGVVMVLILYLYPHLVTALAVSGGLGKAEMLGLAQGSRNIRLIRCHHQDYRRSHHDHDGACKVRLLGEGNPRRVDAYRKPATAHRRGVPKPVRPFPLISYYWEPSIGFRWKGTRYGIRHYGSSG